MDFGKAIALDKEWNRSRKLISVVRHNGRYFIGFGLTTDKAKQAAVDEAVRITP